MLAFEKAISKSAKYVLKTDQLDFSLMTVQVFKGWTLLWLAYQSTGVIYGDIGTVCDIST